MCREQRGRNFKYQALEKPQVVEDKVLPTTWIQILIVGAAILCYGNSLMCGLVFDDKPAICDNKDIRPNTPFSNILYNDFWGTPMNKEESHKSYRPLCVLSFRLNFYLHELHPLGYHLVNMLLHIVVSLLYFRLCCDFMTVTPSFLASMLFVVHPIHTEAVTGVVGRAELMSAMLFLMALRTYICSIPCKVHNDYKAIYRCLFLSGLAMLCKEQGVTVVAVCMTYDVLVVQQKMSSSSFQGRNPRGRIKGPTPTWRKDLILRLLVMTTGTFMMLIIRMKLMGSKLPVFNKFDNPATSSPCPTRQLTHHYLVALNSWLLLFPSDLCCDWTMGTVPLVTSFFDVRTVFTLGVYSVIILIPYKSYYVHRTISRRLIMSLCLCIFPFIPASNLLFPVGFVVAERVLYIPSMGFCLLVAQGWQVLNLASNRKQKYFLNVCFVILLCLHAAKTIKRNIDWQSEETLFRSGLRVTDRNAKIYNNLGHVLESNKQYSEALQLFLKATEVQPDDLGSHLNVGRMYNALGMMEDAEKAFWKAKNLLPKVRPGQSYQTHIVPRHLDLFLNLGSLLSKNQSRLEEAQELYREAISMKMDYIDAYMQRANVLVKLNRSEEAYDVYEEALKHDRTNPDIFYNMGVLLLEQGKSIQALNRFDQALQLDPEHEKSLLNYAILTQESGDSSLRRLAHKRLQVLVSKGRQPERSHFNIGVLAMKEGDRENAIKHFREALQMRPDFDAALFNLALVLYERGDPLEAVQYLQRLSGSHIKGFLLLGNIYFNHLHDYAKAQQCYELILRKDSNHIPALHNLCATFLQMGNLDDAESCLQKAQLVAPGERYFQQHLNGIHQRRRKISKERESSPTYCSSSNCDLHLQMNKVNGANPDDDIFRL